MKVTIKKAEKKSVELETLAHGTVFRLNPGEDDGCLRVRVCGGYITLDDLERYEFADKSALSSATEVFSLGTLTGVEVTE